MCVIAATSFDHVTSSRMRPSRRARPSASRDGAKFRRRATRGSSLKFQELRDFIQVESQPLSRFHKHCSRTTPCCPAEPRHRADPARASTFLGLIETDRLKVTPTPWENRFLSDSGDHSPSQLTPDSPTNEAFEHHRAKWKQSAKP